MSVAHSVRKSIGVFYGSPPGAFPKYERVARELGSALARRGAGLIYGAGRRGVNGALAKVALREGAHVTGVIPNELYERECLPDTYGEIFMVRTLHERKSLIYRLSDAFVVLPGGYDTLDELMEIANWNQIGFHRKPVVLVNVDGFFDPLLAMLDRMSEEGFFSTVDRAIVQSALGAEAALDALGVPPASGAAAGPRTVAAVSGRGRHR